MLVKEWMSTPVITTGMNDDMQQAIDLMTDYHISMLPVMKEGKLVGIVTDRDLKRAAPSHVALLEIKQILYHMRRVEVAAIMSEDPITVRPDTTLEEAAEVLLANKISGCPVVDEGGQVAGVITKNDLFKAMISLSGLRKKGLQYGLLLEDRPGAIKEVTDVIRKYGGRLVSIMTSYDKAPEGFRHVFVRAFNVPRGQVQDIEDEISAKAKLLYVVDHREDKRRVFSDA
jgi:acetoin utilization protein AcuB